MAKKSKKKMSIQSRVLLVVFFLVSMFFWQVSIILLIGMLPTIILRYFDSTPDKTKVFAVGFMNFAGCFPFCFQIIQKNQDPGALMPILSNPMNIVIMYAAAMLGKIIEMGVVNVVAGLMVQKGKGRLVDIKRTQEALVKQWGQEVTGEIPMDASGFPIEVNNS